jgi:hypothetical protein
MQNASDCTSLPSVRWLNATTKKDGKCSVLDDQIYSNLNWNYIAEKSRALKFGEKNQKLS